MNRRESRIRYSRATRRRAWHERIVRHPLDYTSLILGESPRKGSIKAFDEAPEPQGPEDIRTRFSGGVKEARTCRRRETCPRGE